MKTTTSVSKTKCAVFVVGDGRVTGLAGGPLSLAPLGPRQTRRVSHVEFSDLVNAWVVTDAATKKILHQNPDYDAALAWEIRHYNSRLSRGECVLS